MECNSVNIFDLFILVVLVTGRKPKDSISCQVMTLILSRFDEQNLVPETNMHHFIIWWY